MCWYLFQENIDLFVMLKQFIVSISVLNMFLETSELRKENNHVTFALILQLCFNADR